jgi:UDP-glucose 4-epimerase
LKNIQKLQSDSPSLLNPKAKVVVFGGSGFLGSYVADELSKRGYSVTIYDCEKSAFLSEDQDMIQGDILDREKVVAALRGCDCAYNFAGIAGLDEACRDPLKTIEINVLGNTNILEACRVNRIKRFVFASTIYVYSDLATFYRCSKQACELIIEDYQKAYGVDYTILRYGSLDGRRANNFNFIHKIIKQAIEEGKITRKGDGEEIRDYIHVMDAARCSVDILSEDFKNQNVILTGTQSTRVKNLLNMIKEIFQDKITIEYSSEPETGHYEITPYSFRPRVAKKLVAGSYFDLGQGILDVVYDVYSQSGNNIKDLESIRKLIT